MKAKLIITMVLFMELTTVNAQSLGNFSPKEDRGSMGPRKFIYKDIYIANFSVTFQL